MDQRFFELKDRYNLYGLHAGNYKPLEGLASFKIFKNKVNKEIAQMQGEVIAFLKTEGEWDPTWNKEMGLE